MKSVAVGIIVSVLLAGAGGVVRAAPAEYGAPGQPIRLQVGYTPYFSGSWSALVVRGRQLFEKYLPPGSKVEFAASIDGAKIAAGLEANQLQIGYVDDVAAVHASASRAVRLVAVAGISGDQCSVLLVRADAPRLGSPAAALDWLGGRAIAAPLDSCMGRFASRILERQRERSVILDRNVEVITAGLRAGRLDAAVVSEPSASRLIREGVARRVAAGPSLGQRDGVFVAMRTDLIERRPDVLQAWLRAEFEAQHHLSDPQHANEVVQTAVSQTSGFSPSDLWQALYGEHAALVGGEPQRRVALPFAFDEPALATLRDAARHVQSLAVSSAGLRPDAVLDAPARRLLGSTPARAIRAQPAPAEQRRFAAGELSIHVDPRGWAGAEIKTIQLVLQAVAGELLSKFPGRPLAPILVSRSMRAPVALYDRGPGGEYRIELSASGAAPGPYVYEFAHEFCHVLANYERHRHHAVTRNHQWFEEALCEVASLYTLKALSAAWQRDAPSPELAAAAPRLREIAQRFELESHRRLPAGMNLARWYQDASQRLSGSAYDRNRNEIVANLMLPLFEENPDLWEAIGFLNLDAPGASFQQYLQNWLDNAPPRYKDVIRYTISLFFAREPTPQRVRADLPLRPLELIVTFGPGGGADGMARKIAELLEPVIGVPVLVSNVSGASGNAGLTRLLLSPDPEHTLVTLIALTVSAWADGVGTVGPDDFKLLGLVQDSPSMLFVASDSPFRSFADFLDAARAQPGRLRVATSGFGTTDDLTLAYLAAVGFRTQNAPFANPEARYEAAIERQTDALYEEPGDVAPMLAVGRLRPLVTFAPQRHPAFPDVPVAREFGLAIDDLPNFRALAMNASVAPDKVAALAQALAQVLASPEWRRYCAGTYSCAAPHTPADAERRVRAMVQRVSVYRDQLPR